MRYIDIGVATDEGYAMPLATMLYSALSSLSKDSIARIWVVEKGILLKTKRRIETVLDRTMHSYEIHWLNLDTTPCDTIPTKGHITKESFYRILMPGYLKDVDYLIYLDCDMIVNRDLSEILDILPLEGDNIIAAVQGFGAPFAGCERGIPGYQQLGIDPDSPVFNAGVLLIDVKKWESFNVTHKSIELASSDWNEFLIENDQTTLNIILNNRWQFLDPSWNVMHPIYYWDEWLDTPFKEFIKSDVQTLINEPSILHYTSHSKPWHRHCNHPLTSVFMSFLKTSKWFKNDFQYWYWLRMRK